MFVSLVFVTEHDLSFCFLAILHCNTYFSNYETKTRYVCSDFNAFPIVFPNRVTRSNNFDIFW